MIDVLRSRTRSPGAPYRSVKYDSQGQSVKLVFCNPDLLWRSALEQPRVGQGAFIQAFQAVYKVQSIGNYSLTVMIADNMPPFSLLQEDTIRTRSMENHLKRRINLRRQC